MNPTGMLNRYKQSLAEFWAARDARERTTLAAAAAVAAFGLFYALLIDPALTGREQLNKNLPELRQQVAQMQGLSKEAAMFAGISALPVPELSRESIETALAGKGLKPQSVTLSGGLAKVQFASVSFTGTLEWLGEMQKNAKLSVVDANIVALAQPDMVDAILTLQKSKNE
ncbi:MAG: general secretion pathway protein GspM [Gallionellales bacterium RIFCSPLOWO2_12_FULL_59_22]|nr:MAG: general secretion pathway protein GspM [Gallionellales bacterium RIFCSPLOWO2_02_FULL_59_110]OGT01482.1 MAG: general secretion pathway protein GspM [Gallionellales bacterium RIFCSPLOWO2_02_58_13]OGT14715.1 MAG: general secretion pathway protein GspM [Gallionellales bacterium RIFCSPLOWO2_12_FULL_59_22]